MALVNRKTRKAIRKQVTKVIRKHGPEIATGIATGLASTLLTMVSAQDSTEGKGSRKKGGRKGASRRTATQKIVGSLASIPAVHDAVQMLAGSGGKPKAPIKKKAPKRAPVDEHAAPPAAQE